jgi:hypothetical protein
VTASVQIALRATGNESTNETAWLCCGSARRNRLQLAVRAVIAIEIL